MRVLVRMFVLGVVLLAAPATWVYAEIPADEKILVTDPYLLKQMGFEPDDEVYLWTKGQFHGPFSQYLRSYGIVPPESSLDLLEAPETNTSFGQVSGFFAVSGRQFQERSAGFSRGAAGGFGRLSCGAGSSDAFADAQLQVPSGADLEFVRIWGNDTCGAEDLTVFLFEYCLPDFAAGSESGAAAIASISGTGSGGDFSALIFVSGTLNVDNTSCTYQVRASFDPAGFDCTCGNALHLKKIRAQFRRQVSPGPAVPTFTDVPASHPNFREIEALYAAGIDSGCDPSAPGKFCPDAVPTRKELAVLLARALGLHWVFF